MRVSCPLDPWPLLPFAPFPPLPPPLFPLLVPLLPLLPGGGVCGDGGDVALRLSILVVVAENQKNASQDAASQGWCKVVNSDDCSADELAMRCLSLWQQPECLSTMHQKALLYPAVDGAKNIVALMSDQKMTSGDV